MTHDLPYDAPVIPGDPNDIIPKMMMLKPGERLIYHTGNLAVDRGAHSDIRSNVVQIAKKAMELSDEKRAHLTQRRLLSPNGHPYYEYIITGAH